VGHAVRSRPGLRPLTLRCLGGLALLVGDPVELGQELRGRPGLLRVGAHLGERVRVRGGLGLGEVVAARRLLRRRGLLLPRAGLGAVAAARLLALLAALVLPLLALLLLGLVLGGRLRVVPVPVVDAAAVH